MNKLIDKLGWIMIHDYHLLLARSRGKGSYYIPGGKRDPGESDHEALIREIKEELSVDLKPESITYAGTFYAQADGKSADTKVKVTCYYADYIGEIKPDAEIEQVEWLRYADRERCSKVAQDVMDWLNETGRIL